MTTSEIRYADKSMPVNAVAMSDRHSENEPVSRLKSQKVVDTFCKLRV